MATASAKIVISGYYGFRNSGDEAVLKSILNSLEDQGKQQGIQIEPIVLSGDPEWTSKMYGVRSVGRLKIREIRQLLKESDGLISGGGSLLQDSTGIMTIPYYLGIVRIAQWLRKPVFIYAQGVGPVQKKFFFSWIKTSFKRSAYISVRDQESALLLEKMGLSRSKIEVVADPVMGLPLPTTRNPIQVKSLTHVGEANMDSLPVVGISVRFWDKQRRELDGIADGLRLLSQELPVHLRFLPFHLPEDEQASQYVIDRIGDIREHGSMISSAEQVTDPQQMLVEVSHCHAIIGMRLHSLIYAASQSVPLIGISYDPKIDQFLNRLQIQATGTSTKVDPLQLAKETKVLLDDQEGWRASKASFIELLKQDAASPARFIAHYYLAQR
jgi:polysaccharide pyruvyl transferase CsaB